MTLPNRVLQPTRTFRWVRAASLAWPWMYLLCLVPVLTDIVETGDWPHTPRQWFTEIAIGALILLLARRLLHQQRRMFALASTDALTGLWNRVGFDQAVESECARARRSNQPLALVYLDLDHFKTVNDTAGHAAGDAVLCQLGDAMRHVVREHIDRGFRLGGDEFVLLLPGGTALQASAVVERMRHRCVEANPIWGNGSLGISAGIVEFEPQESAANFVRRADEAMFHAKRAHRASGAPHA